MVKGVQKKIIEVNHPDSLYFERAGDSLLLTTT